MFCYTMNSSISRTITPEKMINYLPRVSRPVMIEREPKLVAGQIEALFHTGPPRDQSDRFFSPTTTTTTTKRVALP